jgi:histidine triad (HIT) family protein
MCQSQLCARWIKFLRKLANLPLISNAFVWGLINLNELLPIQKISETNSLICFYHPQPVYQIHILLIPKESIRDLTQFNFEEGDFFRDLFLTVRTLIADLQLEQKGYRLILNGGEYQDFPQLHFHLTSGNPI